MRKAQAAMEFLMTYGWAILVVLVAIGALAYFGVLNPGRFLPESCTLFPGMACTNFKVTDDAAPHVTLIVQNGMGTDLTNVTFTIVGDATTGSCNNTAQTGAPLASFGDGAIETLEFTCSPAPIGTRMKSDVTIAYVSGGLSHSKTGIITTKIE